MMMHRSAGPIAVVAALVAFAGCRDAFDDPDYSIYQEAFDRVEADRVGTDFLPGPDPFQPGDDRLAIGPFYDGIIGDDFSDVYDASGGPGGNYFIFEDTYRQLRRPDRIQGEVSAAFFLTGAAGFWGGGLFFETNPQDLRDYQTLSVAFKGGGRLSFSDIEIQMADADGSVTLLASAYGYQNDSDWHQLWIPLSDFEDGGVDLSRVTNVVTFSNSTTFTGETLLVDNVYFDGDSVEDILLDVEAATTAEN